MKEISKQNRTAHREGGRESRENEAVKFFYEPELPACLPFFFPAIANQLSDDEKTWLGFRHGRDMA